MYKISENKIEKTDIWREIENYYFSFKYNIFNTRGYWGISQYLLWILKV